jgi:transcriptional regulator with XRE-family HTH domain
MDDSRVGAAFRALRLRKGWTQADVAAHAAVSRATVSRIERGHIGGLSPRTLEHVASPLELRLDWEVHWRGGQLDRLLDERHAAMQEMVAARLAANPAWVFVTEASFSVYGERGAIDVFGWNEKRRALLVVELKTELDDLQGVMSTLDRKWRLASVVARERGWGPADVVGRWLILEEKGSNRRRVQAHVAVLRNAFPDDGHRATSWLAEPAGPFSGLSFLPIVPSRNANQARRLRKI